MKTCDECADTKVCQHYRGSGNDPDGPPAALCPVCGGSGICPYCRQGPLIEVVSFFDQPPRQWKPCPFRIFLKATQGQNQAELLAALEAGEMISSTLETLIFRRRAAG